MYQSKDQPSSATTEAAGLMQVAIGPDAPGRTEAPNNEPRSTAPAASTSESLGSPRLSAAPRALAIMDGPPEETLTEELVAANNKIKTWNLMLTTMMMRFDSYCANMSPDAMGGDECVKEMRSKIAVLEERINLLTSRADEITDGIFDADMS